MRKFLSLFLKKAIPKRDWQARRKGGEATRKELIRQAVSRTVREYGDVLKRLGSE